MAYLTKSLSVAQRLERQTGIWEVVASILSGTENAFVLHSSHITLICLISSLSSGSREIVLSRGN